MLQQCLPLLISPEIRKPQIKTMAGMAEVVLEGMFPVQSTNQLKVCVFMQWVFLTTPLLRTANFLPKRYEPT